MPPPPVVMNTPDPTQLVQEDAGETSESDSALAEDIEKFAAERLGVRADEVEITITLLSRRLRPTSPRGRGGHRE